MAAFDYAASPDPIRADLAEAHRGAWDHIAAPGTWLTGPQRVAVAAATRAARDCALCRERKQALSPSHVQGTHDGGDGLTPAQVDLAHRVTTDAPRLTKKYFDELMAAGLTDAEYVETVGVCVITLSIDRFHHALGLPPEPMPEPRPGEPTRVRPDDLLEGEAWVPMREPRAIAREIGAPTAPNVVRALSLVPAEVFAWRQVSNAQYLSPQQMMRFEDPPRALGRAQIELVAGRVSAVNECFY